jgi:hypothetical protein
MAATSRSNLSRLSARAQAAGGAWGTSEAAMLVTSWAFTVLRRCNSVDGKRSSGSFCRLRAISRMWRPANSSRSSSSSPASASSAALVLWISPQINAFSACLSWPNEGSSRVVTTVWRLTAALRISARTTSSVILALCAIRSANWSRAAASGIRAATVNILPRNCRRLPSLFRSNPSAA